MTASPGALHGLRVLDMTRVLAGPLCTMMLGDLGAEVTKVESPGGDDTRGWGPPFVEGESAYFLGANRNKRGIVLNLATPEGRELLAQLLPRYDVLVENYKTGTMARWGFSSAWFEEHAPRLVRCSITGYGSEGPRAAQPGYDFILQAESGLMSICGEIDGAPMKYGVAIVDLTTGMLACNGVLAALNARHATGRGQAVSVSLFESSLALLANVASSHLASGRDARRFGNGHPNIVPYRSFRTADGAIAVAVGNDRQFERFAELLERPAWAQDARFRTNEARVNNRDEIDGAIEAIMVRQGAAHWLAALAAAGIPCGRVNSVAQALADPQCEALDMVQEMEHPASGTVRTLRMPVSLSVTPPSIRRPPPTLGQHTDEVLAEVLGLDAARIATLREQGAIA